MSIDCKLCGNEVNAQTGGRCRQCNQLVCARCIAEGEINAAEGFLCQKCADNAQKQRKQEAVPSNKPATPAQPMQTMPSNTHTEIPLRNWVGFGLLLLCLFLLIAFFPYLHVKYYTYQLYGTHGNSGMQAARELVNANNRLALETLIHAAQQTEHAQAKSHAIEALGEFPHPRARETLQALVESLKTSEITRLEAQEALIRHERLFPGIADESETPE